MPLIIFFSLFVAMLLNRRFKGRALVRAIFFLPIILNADAITEALSMQLQLMTGGISPVSAEVAQAAETSTVNVSYYITLFENLALPRVVLDYIVGAVSRISDIITASGVQIIIFIAALQSIPPALYEVSRIEGATGYETFWKITFPMMMPHIITNVVYTVVDAFAKSPVVDLAYDTAFTEYNYGLSSRVQPRVHAAGLPAAGRSSYARSRSARSITIERRKRMEKLRGKWQSFRHSPVYDDVKSGVKKSAERKSCSACSASCSSSGISYVILAPVIGLVASSFFSNADAYNPMVFTIPMAPTLERYTARDRAPEIPAHAGAHDRCSPSRSH